MKWTIYTLAIIALFIVSAAYAPRAHAEGVRIESYSPREAFTQGETFAPFATCKAITRIVFTFNGSRSPESCGLQEDQAFDVWAYFNVRPYESAADFARWHDSDARNALTTENVERWIVTFAANRWSATHGYSSAMAEGERRAAMEGLDALIHGLPTAAEWQSAYGRFLRR